MLQCSHLSLKETMELKEYLRTRRMVVKEFSNISGLSVSAISKYMCGDRMPTLESALIITQATNGKVTGEDLYLTWLRSNKNG
jgi:transcriptional regulator with XRE-family HTH domain